MENMHTENNLGTYEKTEGLGDFLFQLNPILEEQWLGSLRINMYTSPTELFICLWDGIMDYETYGEGLAYCSKSSYVFKDLKSVFIDKILIAEDVLELYLNHSSTGRVIHSKVTVTENGEIISKKLKSEIFIGPFSKVLKNLSLNHHLICYHPAYGNIAHELITECKLILPNYQYNPDFGLGGNSGNTYSLLGQLLKNRFEALEKVWISSGELTDQINTAGCGLSISRRCFLAFRISGNLHFYLSPQARHVRFSNQNWTSEMKGVFQLDYIPFELNYD